MKNNEIVKKEEFAVSTDVNTDWGVAENSDNSDIVLGRINLVQGLGLGAELIADDSLTCKAGQYWDMQAREFLGSNDKPLDVIMFYSQKYWTIFNVVGDKLEYVENVPFTLENAAWRFDAVDATGAPIKRNLCYRFFCLKADDVNGLPYVMVMTKSNTKTAKLLITDFKKLQQLRHLPSAGVVVRLSSELVKNADGSWFASRYKILGDSTPEQIAAARLWYEQVTAVNSNVVVAADDDVKSDIPF